MRKLAVVVITLMAPPLVALTAFAPIGLFAFDTHEDPADGFAQIRG